MTTGWTTRGRVFATFMGLAVTAAGPFAHAAPGGKAGRAPTPAAPGATAPEAEAGEVPEGDALPATGEELTQQMRELQTRLDQLEQIVVNRRPSVTLTGYGDFGFFLTQGNGAGTVRDAGNVVFPQYRDQYGWVFLGDILSTAVNSRGEAADLGDLPGVTRFDSIHSGGAPGFIVNEVNLTLNGGIADNLLATGSVNFVPRTGNDFALGDFLDVDIAQIEWLPTTSRRTSIFVGKFDSVLGIEYRERKASQRFGITPSLISRYTTGTALGLKVRSKFGRNDMFVFAASVTNGSYTTEQFHFYNEIDRNSGKTLSARASLRPPLTEGVDFELGLSGSWGPQDRVTNNSGDMWFVGVDLLGHVRELDIKAQWLKGKSPGNRIDQAYGLDLKGGGYLELDYMLTPIIGLMARGEFRDALVWLDGLDPNAGENRLYVTKSWRGTFGAHVALKERLILKAEYLHNGEYGGIPAIKNDVFTSSLVFIF
jgi:hypothetical protein